MTNYKALACLLFMSLLIMHIVEADEMMNDMGEGHSLIQKTDCGGLCKIRCSKAKKQKKCLKSCKVCCFHCNCVPPGTAGNRDVCPCYANMTNHRGRKKCP